MKKVTFLAVALFMLPLCSMAQTSHEASRMDVETFVRSVYIHGLPYDAATRYTSDDAGILTEMLQNSENAIYWPNVTMVLGIIAAEGTVESLIDFIHGHDGPVEWSSTMYRGRVSALAGLGYVVNKTKNKKALDYLLASVRPTIWHERNMPWLMVREDADRRALDMSSSAVLALALTGHAAAVRKLNELASDDDAIPRLQQMAVSVRPDLIEIRENGLVEYYGSSLPTVAQR